MINHNNFAMSGYDFAADYDPDPDARRHGRGRMLHQHQSFETGNGTRAYQGRYIPMIPPMGGGRSRSPARFDRRG